MLYLEDYLELIEHLPQELRDRFTDIRERDLQVLNSNEQLKEKVKLFFAEAKELTKEQQQCNYQKLLDEYQETMKYADNKVQIASQMHDIMIKLIQRLDTELEKFKLELEADHAGITEELERRSFELDAESRFEEPINRHLNNGLSQLNHSSSTSSVSKLASKDGRRSIEHKQHQRRHHPYHNNHAPTNGYHARAKLSNHEHNYIPTKHPQNLNQYQRQGSKSFNPYIRHMQTSPSQSDSVFSPGGASISLNGEMKGFDPSEYGIHNLSSSSSSNNPGFRNSTNGNKNNLQKQYANSQSSHHQHSALSAALASNTSQLNSVSALAMTNATSVHNRISNNNIKDNHDLIDSSLINHNPLVAAASQAIAVTQQLQQGRRTPSLKASYAAINAAGLARSDALDTSGRNDISGGNNRNALAPMAQDQQAFRYNQHGKLANNSNSRPLYVSVTTKSGRQPKRPKHHASHLYPDESPTSISSDNSVFENSESLSSIDYIESGNVFGPTSPSSIDFSASANQVNGNMYQRDETLYCICRQISYGEMVACDNKDCKIEWFHYQCVGITQTPKGTWYCPTCRVKMTGHQQQNNNDLSQPQTQKKRGRKEKSMFNLVNSVDIVRSKDLGCEQSKNVVCKP